jgi:thioredoxin reductase (NADPH)
MVLQRTLLSRDATNGTLIRQNVWGYKKHKDFKYHSGVFFLKGCISEREVYGKTSTHQRSDDREVLRAMNATSGANGKRLSCVAGGSGRRRLRSFELKIRNNNDRSLLIDQRMPGMSGVEFLSQAITVFPDAKRVLLTAYADTEAAIAAINEAGINHYLLKPWDPPDANLYPVVDELLEDWEAGFPPLFEGIRVLGNRWSPASHNIKDFLARNHVPYQWLDIETASSDKDVHSLVELLDEEETRKLPIVILPNRVRLKQPTLAELAEHAGLRTRATEAFYDLAIVGGGPAGLAAAVYGASEGLRNSHD